MLSTIVVLDEVLRFEAGAARFRWRVRIRQVQAAHEARIAHEVGRGIQRGEAGAPLFARGTPSACRRGHEISADAGGGKSIYWPKAFSEVR